jgi:hypothetical protein
VKATPPAEARVSHRGAAAVARVRSLTVIDNISTDHFINLNMLKNHQQKNACVRSAKQSENTIKSGAPVGVVSLHVTTGFQYAMLYTIIRKGGERGGGG